MGTKFWEEDLIKLSGDSTAISLRDGSDREWVPERGPNHCSESLPDKMVLNNTVGDG